VQGRQSADPTGPQVEGAALAGIGSVLVHVAVVDVEARLALWSSGKRDLLSASPEN
jgi:hypothetical protein